MATFTHKVQVLLTDEQYRMLSALAEERGKPLSALLRETVVERLLEEARRAKMRKAFEEITRMNLPVAEWEEIEEQIERAHAEAADPS